MRLATPSQLYTLSSRGFIVPRVRCQDTPASVERKRPTWDGFVTTMPSQQYAQVVETIIRFGSPETSSTPDIAASENWVAPRTVQLLPPSDDLRRPAPA